MIRKISVSSFKSLADVTVDLGRVNVFVGANGSGKSNLIEALGVLGAAAEGRVNDTNLLARGVRPGVPDLYKSSFRKTKVRPSIGLEAVSDTASYKVELINNPAKRSGSEWLFKSELLMEGEKHVGGRSPASQDELDPTAGVAATKGSKYVAARTLLDVLADYVIYAPTTSTLRGVTMDAQRREPVGLAGGRLPEAIDELLRLRESSESIADACAAALELVDWAHSFGSEERDAKTPLSPAVEAAASRIVVFRDRYMAKGRDLLTGYDASEGALYVLLMLVLAVHPAAPRLLAVDNADHALNPRLARALFAEMCKWVLGSSEEKQLLLTTHNPLVLDGLPLDHDDVRLFAVDRTRHGKTVVNRVKVDVEQLQKQGEIWTISRLWVMGHLGGMPSV
ncbi:MAG: AAA family ATPase [Deltaproteobacteria bacterium]|nr:AAA family ATPase [Deltaproteobacteria bacterium]